MARQPIQDLQGYGEVSKPAATPVDTYTGTIAAPQQSSAQQLASALGTMSNQAAKLYQQQKANELKEEKELQEQRVGSYIAGFKATEDNPTLDVGDVQGLAPDVALSVIGGLVETDYYQSYYATSLNFFSNLPESVKHDPEKLRTAYNGLVVQGDREVQGDFAKAGFFKGVKHAFNTTLTSNQGELQKLQTGKHEKTSYGMLYTIYSRSGDLSKPENLDNFKQGIIDQDTLYIGTDEVAGISPYKDRAKEKVLLRTNIERLVKQYPEQGLEILNAFETLPWEGDETTEPFVYGLREQVVKRLTDKLEVNNAQTKAAINAGIVDARVNIRNMRAEGDTKGLREIAFGVIPDTLTEAEMALAMESQDKALLALSADVVSSRVSDQNKNALFTKLSTAAYTKDFTFLGFKEGEVPSVIELQDAIYKQGDINFSEQSTLATNMEKILQGYASIDLTKARSQIERTQSVALSSYDLPQFRGLDPAGLMTDAYVDSMRAQLDNHYTDLDSAGQPSPEKLLEFQTNANNAVMAVKQDLDALRRAREGTGQAEQILGNLIDTPEVESTTVEIGDTKFDDDKNPIAKVVGFDESGLPVYEPIEVEEDPYEVTSEGDALKGDARQQKAQAKRNKKAKQSVSNIFNEETATFDLTEDTFSTLTKLVEGRYKRASKRRQTVSEDSVMEMVLDQLGLDGVSDFEYGGIFGDDADTAGEIAIKKIVDSLMENR